MPSTHQTNLLATSPPPTTIMPNHKLPTIISLQELNQIPHLPPTNHLTSDQHLITCWI
jgi:hypothetical protein